MNHPNSNCCPLTWDQRIPNEPLFERNFLIERPPQIPQDFPRTTNECIATKDREWQIYNNEVENTMMNYWHNNIKSTDIKGVNSEKKETNSLDEMTQKYPYQPWLKGIHRNIDKDSQLLNLNYYNPKDCIIPCVQYDLRGLNRLADEAMFKELTKSRVFKNYEMCGRAGGMKTWNQTTSMKMNEPIDYNHEQFIKSCPQLQKYKELGNTEL
jgi:hypothetical protein